jgi:hypothetical protein
MKITKKIIDHDFPTREMVVLTFSETVCEPQEYVKMRIPVDVKRF